MLPNILISTPLFIWSNEKMPINTRITTINDTDTASPVHTAPSPASTTEAANTKNTTLTMTGFTGSSPVKISEAPEIYAERLAIRTIVRRAKKAGRNIFPFLPLNRYLLNTARISAVSPV